MFSISLLRFSLLSKVGQQCRSVQATASGMSVRELDLYQVDAFTHGPGAFTGNPAAVCLVPRGYSLGDDLRQKIAAEMNLSETAYLTPAEGEEARDSASAFRDCSRFSLRWFTPSCEVPLCGHATLASAAALLSGVGNSSKRLFFDTLSGELSVERQPAGAGSSREDLLCMDLPLIEGSSSSVPEGMGPESELVKAAVGELPVQDVRYAAALQYLLIVLNASPESRQAFLQLSPNFQRLHDAHTGGRLTGVIVSVQGEGEYDLLSRFFAPWAGINEDPVTGSAHSVLGPYWAEQLGKSQLHARQSSTRGGDLQLSVDTSRGRVQVAGRAAIVLKGKLLLPPN